MKCCEVCGLTDSQAFADAKTLGLVEEFTFGVYTCCQLSAWAEEQCLAWLDATEGDARQSKHLFQDLEPSENEPVPVLVHLRRPVPWYRRA